MSFEYDEVLIIIEVSVVTIVLQCLYILMCNNVNKPTNAEVGWEFGGYIVRSNLTRERFGRFNNDKTRFRKFRRTCYCNVTDVIHLLSVEF